MPPFTGLKIVFGNLVNDNPLNLQEAANRLGIEVVAPKHAEQAQYLVAGNVLPAGQDDPYLVATQRNPTILVVSLQWLHESLQAEKQLPAEGYRLPPFLGIRVSITNFGLKERDVVVAHLTKGGASFQPDLYRNHTHLVGRRAGGTKHQYAVDWGLFVVHLDWVLHSLEAGRRLDEGPYCLDTYSPAGGASAGAGGDSRATSSGWGPERSAALAGVSLNGQGASAGQHVAAATAGGSSGAGRSEAAPSVSIRGVVPPAPGGLTRYGSGDVSMGTAVSGQPSSTGQAGGGAFCSAGPPHPGAGQQRYPPPLPPRQQHQQQPSGLPPFHLPAQPPDDCFFMPHVRCYVIGCTDSEMAHVLTAVRETGATREPELGPHVTHIVMGSLPSTDQLARVRDHVAEWREQVHVVRLTWLYDCVNHRRCVDPPDREHLVQPATYMSFHQLQQQQHQQQHAAGGAGAGGQRSREGSPAAFGPSGGSGVLLPAGGVSRPGAVEEYMALDGEASRGPTGSGAGVATGGAAGSGPGVFTGLWFTLMAVAGTEEENKAWKLVRNGGGMIMSASTSRSLRDASRRYAVCPYSLPQSAVHRLTSRPGGDEFEKVPPEQRVTLKWLDLCVRTGALVAIKREMPLLRPLPWPLPLKGFTGLVVAVSQYHMEQRDLLRELITLLGGEFTEKMKRRHVHYLVIQEAHGDKFDAAVKWGVPVVRADWVLESAYAGQPLDQLELFLPEGITAEELEARRQQRGMQATQGAGGGGMGSQLVLGPTQRPGAAPPRGMSQGAARHGPPHGLPPQPPPPSAPAPARAPAPTAPLPPTTAPPPNRSGSVPPPAAPSANPFAAPPPKARGSSAGPSPALTPEQGSSALPAHTSGSGLQGPPEQPPAVLEHRNSAAAPQPQQQHQQQHHHQAPPPGAPAAAQPGAGAGGGGAGAGVLEGSAPEAADGVISAMLMQMLGGKADNLEICMNSSQLDMGAALVHMATAAAGGGGGQQQPAATSPTGEAVSGGGGGAEPSRQASASVGMRPPEPDTLTAGGPGGRRSRKRNAQAAVGEVGPGATAAAGHVHGRHRRADDEDEGYGVAMSQQVGYEAVAAAPPARLTRSSARAGRGGADTGADAKASLLKAAKGS